MLADIDSPKLIEMAMERGDLTERLEKAATAAGEDFLKSYANFNYRSDESKAINGQIFRNLERQKKYLNSPDFNQAVYEKICAEADELKRKERKLTMQDCENLKRHLAEIS